MNERCIEECAKRRDCSGFELKPGVNLIDLPRFPIDQIGEMTKEEKFTSVAIYLAKTVDHLKGVTDDADSKFARQRNTNTRRRSPLSSHLSFKDILDIVPEAISDPETGSVCESEEK
jgi:hypothetical protein